ncbi:transcriptional regulator, winged helix family [Kribbella flavida DSM 17836]|uniref:Transcriptional regulator, winged helix family n=1 Tax=Kribbella flavida (strain DSM 17836 / JCM 10339 / NBRC 14399) TaxID=479435 RepID=D2PY33_KRIFD|nr:BTAD domain-containing putative transcriptional regulator [Kribbella flavida]ADB33639.1 transcriptional regulator, winged helix family [Kribbella flavida DSM 17836]
MRFGVLGPVTAWTDSGEAVTVPGLKVRALLADLLVHEGRPVPADRLIDDLWGEDLPGNPAGTLSAKVSQLRRAFEDAEPGSRALVTSGPAGYSLKVDSATYDALQFATLLEQGLLAEALALWRGPAYADFADEPFAEATVARLNEQRLSAQEQYYETHCDDISAIADLVARHPLRERLRAAHIKALYRAGRQSEALDSYEQLRVLLADELGLDPSPELAALQQSVLNQELPQLPQRRSNLPAQLTELIGRSDALAEIGQRLAEGRLLTLTGPGGVGKTRLAVAAAAQVAERFRDGVILVELAGVAPDALDVTGSLTDALQVALDLREAAGAEEGVVDHLASVLGERLLVLDNCEHVITEAAALTECLLAAAPTLRVLATSREPLGLTGEAVWNVPTLGVPGPQDTVEQLQDSSAVQLFVARASAADRAFELDEETAPAVSVLCRRLDGIPLALELAATRVRALGVQGLVARLDDRFRLLATGHRGAAPRQQTLMAMIDWSWELLSPEEQVVLRRLAVHADGCTAEAAEAVCAVDDDVLDVLVRLVDRSLVVPVRGVDGMRYRLLESVAAYCVEKLHRAGEYEAVRERHRQYYTELAELASKHLYGAEQAVWLQRLDEESGNLRSALDGAVAAGDDVLAQRLVTALGWYWFLRGRFAEARRSLEAVPETPEVAAWLAGYMYLHGDAEASLLRDRCLSEVGPRSVLWMALHCSDSGDLSHALGMLEQCLTSFEQSGDRWGIAAALAARAKHAHVRTDLDALQRDAGESARLFRALGDRWGQLQALGWLGAHAELVGDFRGAVKLHTEALRMAEELGLWPDVAAEYGWLGWTAIREGDYAQATAYGEQAFQLALEQGHRPLESLGALVLGFAARRSGDLDVAEKRLQTLVDEARRQDDSVLYLPMVLDELGFLLSLQGEALAARALHVESYGLGLEQGSRRSMAWSLEGIAGTLVSDAPAVAARLLGAAAAVQEAEGLPATPAETADPQRIAEAARALLGERYDAEFAAGRSLSLEEAFALVPGA